MLEVSDCLNMDVLVLIAALKLVKCSYYHQDRIEPMHLPKMQAGDDWKGNRHGGIPEVHRFLYCLRKMV